MKQLILLALFAVGCSTITSKKELVCEESTKGQVGCERVCVLGEDKNALGAVGDFAFINDTTLLVQSDENIFLYSIDGEQLGVVGRRGQARGEYIYASRLRIYGDKLYLLCSYTQKIVIYDLHGNFIEEYVGVNLHPRDFVVVGELIYFYYGGSGTDKSYILVYDTSTHRVITTHEPYKDVDKMLTFYGASNGLAGLYEDGMIYVKPSTLETYKVSGERGEKHELLFDISSPNYIVDDSIDFSTVMQNAEIILDFIHANGNIMMVELFENTLYIVTSDSVDRFRSGAYLYNNSLLTIDMESMVGEYRPIETTMGNNVLGYRFYNGDIYSLRTSNDNENYYITKLKAKN